MLSLSLFLDLLTSQLLREIIVIVTRENTCELQNLPSIENIINIRVSGVESDVPTVLSSEADKSDLRFTIFLVLSRGKYGNDRWCAVESEVM